MDAFITILLSMIPLAIVKAFEVWQKSKEHNYSMQTAYFQRKLEAAETAIMGFKNELTYYEKYVAIIELFENAPVEKFPFLLKKIQEISDEYKNSVHQIENSIIKIYFYYDLEEDINFSTNYKNLIELLVEIDNLTQEIEVLNYLLTSHKGDKKNENILSDKILEKGKEYVPIFKKMNNLINITQRELYKNIKMIKKEMSKYNPA